ncbi:MAG: hypothetical protein IK018_05815 [Lachnospiraceae bacterium]|nr:hypothetical protein [Lachnospiraceae bacterium]MBR5993301.1 hypothetical protein [Lachnospiraceae bacterium]
MKCNYCGAEIADDSVKCPYCEKEIYRAVPGQKIEITDEDRAQFASMRLQSSMSKKSAVQVSAQKFSQVFTYLLWLSAAMNVFSAVKVFTGFLYGDVPAAEVYEYYGNALKYTDYLYAVLILVMAGLCAYAAICVKKSKPYAYKLVIAICAVMVLADVIYGCLTWKITGINTMFNVRFLIMTLIRCYVTGLYAYVIKKGSENG